MIRPKEKKSRQLQRNLQRDKGIAALLLNINNVAVKSRSSLVDQANRRLEKCFEEWGDDFRKEGNAGLDILEGLQKIDEYSEITRFLYLPVGNIAHDALFIDQTSGSVAEKDPKKLYLLALRQALNGVQTLHFAFNLHTNNGRTVFYRQSQCEKFGETNLEKLAGELERARDSGQYRFAHIVIGHKIVEAYAPDDKGRMQPVKEKEGIAHIYVSFEYATLALTARPLSLDVMSRLMESGVERYLDKKEVKRLLAGSYER